MNPELYQRMLPVFLDEAELSLAQARTAVASLAADAADDAARQELIRAAHTLKGNAAMLGLREIIGEAQRLESWAHSPPGGPGHVAAMYDALGQLRRVLADVAADANLVEAR